MKTIAFIFARGGSKGIPNKNLALLDGVSLLARAITSARKISSISRVIVSTDDPKIAKHAIDCGAEAPFVRPAELASDTAAEHDAWKHAITELRKQGEIFDTMLVLPATAPLRATRDIEECLRVFQTPETDIVITVQQSERNPYFNMVVANLDGTVRLASNTEDGAFTRRQDAPAVFDITTVAYVANPDFVMRSKRYFDGRVRAVEVPRVRAVDIDVPLDLEWAEFLIRKGHPDILA
ncbi:MAG: acylneuraminate cytidylyltransferase family protein [Chthoniobacterales bacterium]